jgi:hypothetical protein
VPENKKKEQRNIVEKASIVHAPGASLFVVAGALARWANQITRIAQRSQGQRGSRFLFSFFEVPSHLLEENLRQKARSVAALSSR